jgi:large subunit ribosomal protein L24
MSLRIKRDDMVMVISGDDKGVRGRVLAINVAKGTAIVEGVRLIKKHQRARSQTEPGGINEKEAPIDISNLMLCEEGGQGRAARYGVQVDAQGNKTRKLKLKDDAPAAKA